MSWLAKEVGISNETLHDFACGTTALSNERLQALTEILFNGHAVFDEKLDRLRSARQAEPTTTQAHRVSFPDRTAAVGEDTTTETGATPGMGGVMTTNGGS